MQYFAYGSNMNPDRMEERNINFTSRQFAKLNGYKLIFNKKSLNGIAANIENSSDSDFIEGALYEFPDTEIVKLDKAEGYPNHYDRLKVVVMDIHGNIIETVTYIAQPDKVVNGQHPTKDYLNHLLAAKDILSDAYFEKLTQVVTID